MCIIVVKPEGVPLPEVEKIKNCFINNNDGAGFSFVKENRIYLSKGYGKFKPFMRAVNRYIKEETPAILHFRIASIGSVCEENCHPFILSENKKEIDKTINCTKSPIFAHNGNLPMSELNGKSDTRQYARIIGDPVIKNNLFRNDNLLNILGKSVGINRLAFMDRKGDMRLLGDFEEDKGIYYSNLTYNYRRTTTSNWERDKWERERDEHIKAAKERREAGHEGYGGCGYRDEYYRTGINQHNDEEENFVKIARKRLEDAQREGKEVDRRTNKELWAQAEEDAKDIESTVNNLFSKGHMEKEEEKEEKEVGEIITVTESGVIRSSFDKEKKLLEARQEEIDEMILDDPNPQKRLIRNAVCETCRNTRLPEGYNVYYFFALDSYLCTSCWQLYFGGFTSAFKEEPEHEEVVNEKNGKKKRKNKKGRRNL